MWKYQPITCTLADFSVDEEVTFRYLPDTCHSASNMTLDSIAMLYILVDLHANNAAQEQSTAIETICIPMQIHRGSVLMELVSCFQDPAIMNPIKIIYAKMIFF